MRKIIYNNLAKTLYLAENMGLWRSSMVQRQISLEICMIILRTWPGLQHPGLHFHGNNPFPKQLIERSDII
jgi:hypothetical protein